MQLKEHIIAHPDLIVDICEAIGLHKIRVYPTEVRCAKTQESNPTGIRIKKDTLSYHYWGHDREIKGDIYTMVMDFWQCSFVEAIRAICDVLKLDYTKKPQYPFGGYYKKCKTYSPIDILDLPTYEEDILDSYMNRPIDRFLQDGIYMESQEFFKVRYDLFTERIVVPWRNVNGEIVGLMGRYNDDHCEERGIAKWLPIISFPKTQLLYGFYENYQSIQQNKMILLLESEKGVQQCHSMGYYFTLAVGCHSVSPVQTRYIKGLFPEQVIICFDEGIDEEYLREQARLLKFRHSFYTNQIGYVFDRDHQFMKKGSKVSPSDLRKDIMQELLRKSVVWL